MSQPEKIKLNEIMLPTPLERQQIFHLLKKLSSVTAWQRILGLYHAWAEATEKSLRVAEQHDWGTLTSLPQSEYAYILRCLAHCEEGVLRLSRGDKRVFKFDGNGKFAMARRILSHYSQLLERIDIGENRINEEHTPLWPEFCDALMNLAKAWGECAVLILESRYTDDPAILPYNSWLISFLKATPFPDALGPVPDPQDNLFIRTGSITPCSGIWEPIDAPKPSLIKSLLGKAEKPQAPFTLMGSMNYLHGGSPAPTVRAYIEGKGNITTTTWRLLWRDDRYTDGTVPEEERHYQFTQPQAN